ncbi:hypothetical protein O9992_22855 [Vibrio lentus]|nr:hypothetical protein [Vibrio lentus]
MTNAQLKPFGAQCDRYLLKPINEERLLATCQKVQARLSSNQTQTGSTPGTARYRGVNESPASAIISISITASSTSYLSRKSILRESKASVGEDIHLIAVINDKRLL